MAVALYDPSLSSSKKNTNYLGSIAYKFWDILRNMCTNLQLSFEFQYEAKDMRMFQSNLQGREVGFL